MEKTGFFKYKFTAQVARFQYLIFCACDTIPAYMDVIATIWKKPYYFDRNQKMIDAGADCFRIKCSHRGVDDINICLHQAREQIDKSGKKVLLLADLPEAKIRLGEFPQEKQILPVNKIYKFKTSERSENLDEFIPVKYPELAKFLKVGDRFYTGEGQLLFEVVSIRDNDHFEAKTINSGVLTFFTGITIPGVIDKLDHITPAIDEILAVLPETKPELVAFSFVSSGEMLKVLMEKLKKHTTPEWQPKVIAKIESQGGIDNIDEILDLADGIMVARGDLAFTIPYAELGLAQKYLVKKAKEKNKYSIVSTQVLSSLLTQYIPVRSDILDVTNAVLDGASAIMLCQETAHSETPWHSVEVAKEIIKTVEKGASY